MKGVDEVQVMREFAFGGEVSVSIVLTHRLSSDIATKGSFDHCSSPFISRECALSALISLEFIYFLTPHFRLA